MCGIVGYIGDDQAAPILLNGLSKLEYRGYDSAGIAVYNGKKIEMEKVTGRLERLKELTKEGTVLPGTVGIGHTRWATHGSPSDTNAHPHFNKDRSILVVHNGIIENYNNLKHLLMEKGYEFISETDTEVLAHLLDYYYKRKHSPLEALIKVMQKVEGSYALGILFEDFPGQVFSARKDSPLIVGHSEHGNFIASDVPAILQYTRNVYYIENEEIAVLSKDDIKFYNVDEEPVKKEEVRIDWDISAAEKGGYEHFFLKEIYEQPKAIRDTLHPRIKNDEIIIEELDMTDEYIRAIKKIMIVACGSAYHTGVMAKYVFEGISRIPVEVDLASEYRYRNPIFEENTLVIIVSQSGETADSLAALRESKKNGQRVLGIVNVVGSSIAREADNVVYTWAGPEISVATTKAYSAQLAVFYLLALKFGKTRKVLIDTDYQRMIKDLLLLPQQIEELLEDRKQVQRFANRYLAAEHIFFIGRGVDYAISMEGSLKLKEISYIHSEAYAAGELKHGTISLIANNTLVVAIATQEALYPKMISNIVEVKTRGAFVMALTNENHSEITGVSDYTMTIPTTNSFFTGSLAMIPLQLFAYYVSLGKGLDVDKPRNLAKSVTVE
ncbi:MAG: glutamine--fructose-6-phosphate transaminase (isomerizing) [Clostridium sp.]